MSLEPYNPAPPPIPRDTHGRFAKGAPGRPKGALNKMSTRIAMALLEDFESNHRDVLQVLRVKDPSTYARLVIRIAHKCDFTDDEAIEPLRADPKQEVLTKGLRAMRADAPRQALVADYRAMEQAAEAADPAAAYAETLGDVLETHIARTEAGIARDLEALAEPWPDILEDDEDEDDAGDDAGDDDPEDPEDDEPGIPPYPWAPPAPVRDDAEPPLNNGDPGRNTGPNKVDTPPSEEAEAALEEPPPQPPRPSASSFDWSPPPLSWKTA